MIEELFDMCMCEHCAFSIIIFPQISLGDKVNQHRYLQILYEHHEVMKFNLSTALDFYPDNSIANINSINALIQIFAVGQPQTMDCIGDKSISIQQ